MSWASEEFQFGRAWAAAGECRPSHFRTVLAHAPGYGDGGAVWVEEGLRQDERQWISVAEWRAWKEGTKAALVPPVEADETGEA